MLSKDIDIIFATDHACIFRFWTLGMSCETEMPFVFRKREELYIEYGAASAPKGYMNLNH